MAAQRCHCDGCSLKVAMIVGHCKYCDNDFCLKHRLPESHDCVNRVDCHMEAKKQLEEKLRSDADNARKPKL